MGSIKQQRHARLQRQRLRRHKRSMIMITAVLVLLIIAVSVNVMTLQAKNKEYQIKEAELQTLLDEEEKKTQEIEELETYIGTNEHIEEVAKENLGLVYPDEIIFKPAQ